MQWAPRVALSAAARLPAAEGDVSRPDEALLEEGADPNARLTKQGLVHDVQLRSARRGRDRRDAVLARRLRAPTSPAMKLLRRVRRRPEHPDDRSRAGRADAARRRAATAQRRSVRPAAGPVGGPGRSADSRRGRRRLRPRLRRQLASPRARRLAAGGEVSSSRSCTPTSTRAITTATPRCTTPPRAATTR